MRDISMVEGMTVPDMYPMDFIRQNLLGIKVQDVQRTTPTETSLETVRQVTGAPIIPIAFPNSCKDDKEPVLVKLYLPMTFPPPLYDIFATQR
jgi:hypothetical protein